MAITLVDVTTPQPGGRFGDPAKVAYEKVNASLKDLDTRKITKGEQVYAPGFYLGAQDNVNQPYIYNQDNEILLRPYDGATAAYFKFGKDGTFTTLTGGIDNAGQLSQRGPLIKPGVLNVANFQIRNFGEERGIGGPYSQWATARFPAVQVDAQANSAAYLIARSTRWGARHLWGLDVYSGGTDSSAVVASFHFDVRENAHQFISNGSMIIAGTLTQNSDYRIKSDVQAIRPEAAAGALRGVRPIEYTDNTDTGKRPRRAGVLAHELQECLPLLVHGSKDEVETISAMEGDTTPYQEGEEPEGYVPPVPVRKVVPKLQNVNYAGMAPYLAAGWQFHDNRIAELEAQVVALQEELCWLTKP